MTELEELLSRAEDVDDEEDRRYGQDRRGDELPQELAYREGRLEKIREAMPGFRPGRLGLSVRLPLENGAAWRLPARCAAASCLRSSLLASVRCAFRSCNRSTCAIRSACSQAGGSLSVHIAGV